MRVPSHLTMYSWQSVHLCCNIWKCMVYKTPHEFIEICAYEELIILKNRTLYTVFFKTRGHLSRLAWPTQRDGLSCLSSPRLALRCAAWPSKTNPDPCSRPVATSGCSHRYYNGIVHNAKCISVLFGKASDVSLQKWLFKMIKYHFEKWYYYFSKYI